MPAIPVLATWDESEAFAKVIGVPYVKAGELNEEERAALRKVYDCARQRLGVEAQLAKLGYSVWEQALYRASKRAAAATAVTTMGLVLLKRKK